MIRFAQKPQEMDWNNTSNLILSCKAMSSEKHRLFFIPLTNPFRLCQPHLSTSIPFSLISFKQTIHWVRAFTYGAISSSLNSRNGKSTPTTATEQFSFVSFCITLPFFASYRIALHAALQRIQHDANQLVERHCSSLHSIPFIQSSLTVTTFVSSFKKRRDRAVFALWLREPIAHALYSRYSPEGDVWKR